MSTLCLFVPLAVLSWAISGLVIGAAEIVRGAAIEYLARWEARRNG